MKHTRSPAALTLGRAIGVSTTTWAQDRRFQQDSQERKGDRTVSAAPLLNPKGGVGGLVAFKF